MPLRRPVLAALTNHPRAARHLLVACGLVAGFVLALGTALLIVQTRRDDIGNAGRELKNLSFVLAEETDRAFQTLELVQLDLIQHMREQGIDTPEKFDRELGSQAVQQDLRQRIAGLPQIITFRLISRGGQVISLSTAWPTPHATPIPMAGSAEPMVAPVISRICWPRRTTRSSLVPVSSTASRD